MLALAKECTQLKVFCHVSTCYVNCDKAGFVQEKIYPINDDPDELMERIMNMTYDEAE